MLTARDDFQSRPAAAVALIVELTPYEPRNAQKRVTAHYARLRHKWPIAGARVKMPEKETDNGKAPLPLDFD